MGDLLEGKYELVNVLGEGGMGVVYEARHLQLGKRVALKLLLPQLTKATEATQRFIREAQAAAGIGHPGIIDVYDMGRAQDGALFIVMELLDGESLGELLLRQEVLDTQFACYVACQVLSALDAAHNAGIVHRDLKPDNIFLKSSVQKLPDVKLLDFGIAKMIGSASSSLTRPGYAVGTPDYMSPEQARADSNLDHRMDLWAVGVVLYECLTGVVPFVADNPFVLLSRIIEGSFDPPRQHRPEISEELEKIILRAMRTDRDQRYGTSSEMLSDLLCILDERVADRVVLPDGFAQSQPYDEAVAELDPDSQQIVPPKESRVSSTEVTVPKLDRMAAMSPEPHDETDSASTVSKVHPSDVSVPRSDSESGSSVDAPTIDRLVAMTPLSNVESDFSSMWVNVYTKLDASLGFWRGVQQRPVLLALLATVAILLGALMGTLIHLSSREQDEAERFQEEQLGPSSGSIAPETPATMADRGAAADSPLENDTRGVSIAPSKTKLVSITGSKRFNTASENGVGSDRPEELGESREGRSPGESGEAETVSISLRNLPEGSRIFLDGTSVDENPFRVSKSSEQQVLEVRAEGFRRWSKTISTLEALQLTVTMEPLQLDFESSDQPMASEDEGGPPSPVIRARRSRSRENPRSHSLSGLRTPRTRRATPRRSYGTAIAPR